MERGPVDVMIERWARERPDLDASSLAIVARVTRLARAIDEDAAATLREFNLTDVEFQLLAAIRTAPDCRAAPRTLLQPLMVTSGGLTNRIDRLEAAGWIVRAPNPADRRGVFLKLTRNGRDLVDRVDRGLSGEPAGAAPRSAHRRGTHQAGAAAAQAPRFVVRAQRQTETSLGSGARAACDIVDRGPPAPLGNALARHDRVTTTSSVSPSRRIVTVTSSPGL